MKHIKLLAALTLFFSATMASAQAKTAVGWPQLQTVQEVAARISTNVDNNNQNAFTFSETLAQHAAKLVGSNIPKEYVTPTVKQDIADLQTKSDKLAADSKGKSSFDALKTQFTEIQALIAKLAKPTAKK